MNSGETEPSIWNLHSLFFIVAKPPTYHEVPPPNSFLVYSNLYSNCCQPRAHCSEMNSQNCPRSCTAGRTPAPTKQGLMSPPTAPGSHHLPAIYCRYPIEEESVFVLLWLDLLFLFRIVLTLWGPLRFHRNFSIAFFHFCQKCQWGFDRDYSESVDHFVKYEHFDNIKSSSSWRQDVCALVIYLNLLSFSIVMQSSLYRTFASLVEFILKYFTLWCYCKWNCFLNSLFGLLMVSI